MITTAKNSVDAYSFSGLLASEGQIPGTVSGTLEKTFLMAEADTLVREFADDLTARGSFFELMEDNGLMKPVERKKRFQFKITRPTGLGGGFGGFTGGSLGGGALAH